jgi:hypothetical protein
VKRHYRTGLSPAVFFVISLVLAGCGVNDPPEDVADGPCPGESGFGARLASPDGYVDVCVADDSVVTVFTEEGWYRVEARMTGGDGTVYRFSMLFPHHTTSRKLNITGNLAEARADANGAWFQYRETPPDEPATESTAVTAGTFRLGYSDTEVVAGMFENLILEMEVSDLGEPAGTQAVAKGFFSILTDTTQNSTSY